MSAKQEVSGLLRLVVVDDHDAAREGIAASLDAEPDLAVVGQAGTVSEAREVICAVTPDVAVVDLNLPDGSGRELVKFFATALPELRCIIHTGTLQELEAESLFGAGADAVVLKSLSGSDLLDAVRNC